DDDDQMGLVKAIIKEMNLNDKMYPAREIKSIISDAKNRLLAPREWIRETRDDFRAKKILEVYETYEKRLRESNALDFDDLIMKTIQLLTEQAPVLDYYRRKFEYILVDEYQDTNLAQYEFIRLLAGEKRNVCVVGDDDQSIYGWRGADIRNILEFEKDFPGTKVVKLEQNYRSTSNILEAAHSVIMHNRERKNKKLWTEAEKGHKITYYRGEDERDEANFIGGEINRVGGSYRDYAILYRTNSQSRTFEEALSRRGIPYRVLGGLRYYDRKEVKDMLCYMRLVQNSSDDLSLVRIINEPKRGIGSKTVEKLQTLAKVRDESLFDTISDTEVISSISAKASKGIEDLVRLISSLGREKDNMRISDIYDVLLVNTGYLKMLEDQNTVESESRIENLMEFKSVIYDYEEEDSNITLAEFMERIALLSDVDNHDEQENAVTLMTLHSAKGLEFPYVFMPGMEDGLFPGWRSFDRPEGLEEERRLCYVGITRARERLWMTSAAMRTLYGKTDFTRESQFLKEIDRNLIEGDAVYEKKTRTSDGAFVNGMVKEKPFKPFDKLKYASALTRQNAENMKKSGEVNFAQGDTVSHPKFGSGSVVSCGAKTVEVKFADGVKKLALGIAPLKKL
ncbi:MAG: 3'-5' exonuclease, partial [Firmicutes bacterium]|nr:3'-5' exonuclease [Bacillota bacterium]